LNQSVVNIAVIVSGLIKVATLGVGILAFLVVIFLLKIISASVISLVTIEDVDDSHFNFDKVLPTINTLMADRTQRGANASL